MSVKNTLDKLANQIGIKRCIIIEGNVNDIYEHQGKYINLKEKVNHILSNKGYDDVFMWDRIDGLTNGNVKNLVLVDEKTDQGEVYDFAEDLVNQQQSDQQHNSVGQFKTLAEFFAIVRRNMLNNENKKNAFVADFSDYLFSSEQGLSETERVDLIGLLKALRDKKFNQGEIAEFDTALIFITSNVGKLPFSFYLNNPDVVTLNIAKPSRKEREQFIQSYKRYFRIKEDLVTDKFKLQDIYDTIESWTLKEVYQLIKYSNNINEVLPFDKLINAYQYGEKSSPWEEMNYEKVSKIEESLKDRVIGQNHAILKVKSVVYKAFTGLSGVQYSAKRTKPKATLFFVGPTGVGKTELAKALAKFLFGDESNCIRFDMSEYSQEHSDQKLIGAPPGYVGYEQGGQLTNAIKEKPFSVLLFDEIEKAHPRILDKFLQILEDGRLTDNKGETVSFSDSFIIFTSNISAGEADDSLPEQQVQKFFIEKVSDHFRNELKRPELLGRIGNNIVPFNFIKDINFKTQLITNKLRPIIAMVKEKYHLDLEFANIKELVNLIINSADDKKGGRDLLNSIENHVIDPLSEFIFANMSKISSVKKMIATVEKDNKLEFLFAL